MVLKKVKIYLVVFLSVIFFSCSEGIDKERALGTFKIIRNDSTYDFMIRDKDLQIRFYNNSNKKNQLCKLEWKSNNRYYYKIVNPKTKYDSLSFKVEIDNISNDTFYESIYPTGIKNKTLRRMIKLSDTLGEDFLRLKRRHRIGNER